MVQVGETVSVFSFCVYMSLSLIVFMFVFNILSEFYKVCNLYCKDKQSWQKIEHLSNAFIKMLRATLVPDVRNYSDVLSERL